MMSHPSDHRDWAETLPPPKDGIRLKAQRRPVGTSEAGRELVAALELGFDGARRAKGAQMAREGRIHRLRVADDGTASARAVGTKHYEMALRLARLDANARAGVLAAIEREGMEGMGPLASDEGSGPEGLITHRFQGRCTCLYGPHCKHLAALCYLLAEAVDQDPMLLLVLRGVPRESLAKALAAAPQPPPPRQVSPSEFFEAPAPRPISVPVAPVEQILARLGPAPPGLSEHDVEEAKRMLGMILSDASGRLS